ncbi:hypothetical protein [Halorubrum ezzemoulense]|uniref:hypothetical protein n=1 Tax=Halorubrum ezzemoulense TaxID=337243 RepID=UPI001595A239|nr:hypothetical protein [Halorubrum ezzemoulense]
MVAWTILHFTGRIDYGSIRESILDKFYSENFEITSLIVLLLGNQILGWIYGVSFSSLDTNIQMIIVGFLMAFYINNLLKWTKKVIYEIIDPKMKAMLNLNPEHKGEFDVLVGDEDVVDDRFDVVGADELHEKPAGPDGAASVMIARGIDWVNEVATASWRALKDPLEVEDSEANIYYNSKMIQNELDEARSYRREALVYKQQSQKKANETANRRIDEVEKMDEDDAYEDIMQEAHARYDPRSDDLDAEGVKEKFEDDEAEEDEIEELETETESGGDDDE